MNKLKVMAAVALTVMVTGCVSNLSGTTYSREEARKVQEVEYGVVQATTLVVIEGTEGIVGGGAGAIIGGLAGSSVGGGTGSDIAAVVGAVAGGLAGSKLEEQYTRSQGQEITVQLNSGRTISVVQAVGDGPVFKAGDRVRILDHQGTTRVVF